MERIAPLPPSPSLDARDLRLVLALVSAGTTARAAELLHLAQPSVSRALLSLEERLDTRLFDRTSSGLVPNAAGNRIASRAHALLDQLLELERAIRQPAQAPTRIRLVCECVTAYHWLPSTLTALRRDLPGVEPSIHLEHTHRPLEALENGDIDAALVTSPCKSTDTIRVARLFSDELVFVVSSSHPLVDKPALTPSDLARYSLITGQPTGHEARWFVARVFGRSPPQLDVVRMPLTEAAVDLARAGLGIAILTEWVTEPYEDDPSLAMLRLSKGPLRRPWRLAYRRDLEAAGTRLAEALRRSRVVPG